MWPSVRWCVFFSSAAGVIAYGELLEDASCALDGGLLECQHRVVFLFSFIMSAALSPMSCYPGVGHSVRRDQTNRYGCHRRSGNRTAQIVLCKPRSESLRGNGLLESKRHTCDVLKVWFGVLAALRAFEH